MSRGTKDCAIVVFCTLVSAGFFYFAAVTTPVLGHSIITVDLIVTTN